MNTNFLNQMILFCLASNNLFAMEIPSGKEKKLFDAIATRNENLVIQLIKDGANLETKSSDRMTPLMTAIVAFKTSDDFNFLTPIENTDAAAQQENLSQKKLQAEIAIVEALLKNNADANKNLNKQIMSK